MADPLKVFTGLLDAIGEGASAVKPTAPLKVAKTAAKGYFDSIAKTGADYFADIVKTKQDVPKPSTKSVFDEIEALLAETNKPTAPKPAADLAKQSAEDFFAGPGGGAKPPGAESFDADYAQFEKDMAQIAAVPAPKPTFAQQAVKTAQQQALKLPPTAAPPTMHPDVLPEAERQAARLKGNYVTEAFRGVGVQPGGDFQGVFKGSELYSSVSAKLADMYTSYLGKHPGLNPKPGEFNEGASVVPLWLDTSDYLYTDAKGAKWTVFNPHAIAEAKAQGKKGVIIDNVWDEPASTKSLSGPQKVFVTFPNGQGTVKSKFAARFDPTSKDISRGIAAVGITGAAGTIAMAPGEAKAEEAPALSPYTKKGATNFTTDLGKDEPAFRKWVKDNKAPFNPDAKFADYDMRGYWRTAQDPAAWKELQRQGKIPSDMEPMSTKVNPNDGKPHYPDYWKTPYHKSFSAESQWADPATAPNWNAKDQLVTPDGKVVFDERAKSEDELPANAQPTEGQGYFADLLKEPTAADKAKGIFIRSPDDPDAIAPSTAASYPGRVKDIPGDVKDVFEESRKEYKEGTKATGEAFSREELKKYNEYEDAYRAWEKGGMKGEPPKNPGTGPGKALKGISDVAGGFFGAATSWLTGPWRSMVSRPVEEKTGLKHEWTEAVGSLVMPFTGVFKYGRALPKAAKVVDEVGTFLNRIFNPEKIGKGDRAETVIRNALGMAARDTETTKASFEEYYKAVNALADNDKVALIGYIEGRTKGATITDPALQPVADAIKTAVDLRKTKLQALPSTHQMAFVEDYYTHQWENAQQAQQFVKGWFAKQGTGKNLKKRSIPTIADGMAAGLTPKTLNPLETITDYVTNMDRFIAHNAIIDAGRAVKDVKYYRKPQVAAQLGLVKLEGRLALRRTKYGDMQAYAPKDWARVYNNSIAKGWHQWETAGQIYDKLQTASNSITAMELGLSGYHLLTMVNEGSIASVATAVSQAVSGVGALSRGEMKLGAKLLAGSAKSAALAPAAFGVKPYLGHKAQQVYLGRSAGSTIMRKTMDLLEAGGGRAIGRGHAADYKFTAANSYFTAFKRGELLASLKADASKGPLRFFARQLGRTLQSFAQPLFEVYIPKMKVGAFHENMSAWLAANPAASYADQVKMAKRIWDSVDNRFGEVVQDNIFWHTMLKQTAQLGMRSYSWNLGTIREIGGGAKGALQPKSLGLKGTGYDPKTGYVVALPITTALVNAMYQYAMTGKMPEDVNDLVAPRTGGTVPGFGGRGQVPERAQLPSYMKDVFGWYDDWYQEAANKRSSLIASGFEIASNRDWKGDPIINPEHSAPEWMKEYFQYAEKFFPISVKQGLQGEKKGSALGLQSYLGIRPSPAQFTDPKGRASFKKYQGEQIDKKRKKAEARQKQVYGGPSE